MALELNNRTEQIVGSVTTLDLSVANAGLSGSGGGKYQGNNGDVNAVSGVDDIFRTHTNLLTANTTIPTGQNSLAAGPLTVDTGVILTVDGELVIA